MPAIEIQVLVVDDEPDILGIISDSLQEDGMIRVTTSRSGNEAIDLMKQTRFDVIVADYYLPPGINSLEVLSTIRSQGIDTPFIVFTGRSREEVAIEALNRGASFYLQKGVDIDAQIAQLRSMIIQLAGRARAEQALADHQKELVEMNRELESFCFSVSHDLRAPVRIIDGYCRMLKEKYRGSLPGEAAGIIDRIESANTRMNEMIEALLLFSRAGRAEMKRERVSLTKIAEDKIGTLRQIEPGRNVLVQVQQDLTAECDRALIQRVVENLIDNAWKYTAKTASPGISVGSTEKDGTTVFFVRDNGAGFDAASAKELFMPFARFHAESEFPGYGIGLATARRIIERHNGRIWAESTKGKGATLYFTLPSG